MLINKKKKILLINKNSFKILLINKILYMGNRQDVDQQIFCQNFVDQQNFGQNFVDQQNSDFSILSLARGDRPPRGSARQIFWSHLNSKP